MEGVLPSRLWQPERSWSRRDAAKDCEGMHGRVCEHGAPAVDQGVGEGVAQ